MRNIAIIENQESLSKLLDNNFLSSPNNIILICNNDIEFPEQNFIEYLDIAHEIILQREHEQQQIYFEKMFNAPSWGLRFFMPSTPKFVKKYIQKHDFATQRKLWAYVWPQYRKDILRESNVKRPSVWYAASIFLLPRLSALFAYALVFKTKVALLMKRKFGIKFTEAELEQALMHRVDFHDPDMIICDSKKLMSITQKLKLCPVTSLEYFIDSQRAL